MFDGLFYCFSLFTRNAIARSPLHRSLFSLTPCRSLCVPHEYTNVNINSCSEPLYPYSIPRSQHTTFTTNFSFSIFRLYVPFYLTAMYTLERSYKVCVCVYTYFIYNVLYIDVFVFVRGDHNSMMQAYIRTTKRRSFSIASLLFFLF